MDVSFTLKFLSLLSSLSFEISGKNISLGEDKEKSNM